MQENNLKEEISKLKERMRQVPFGNSQFQIVNFTANQVTPERSYRSILLQLDSKLKAMQECSFRRREKEIELEEIKEKISSCSRACELMQKPDSFELRKLLLELEKIEYYLNEEIKLIEDCAVEIKTYEALLNQMPEYTREEFEKGERLHWEKRLITNILEGIQCSNAIDLGSLQALKQLGVQIKTNNGQLEFYGNIENKKELGLIDVK